MTLSPGGNAIAATSLIIQPDGKLLIAGTVEASTTFGELVRLNANGGLDSTFNGTGYVWSNFGGVNYFTSAVVNTDGEILVTGSISPVGNFNILVARYTASGAVDTTFGNGGDVITSIGPSSSNGEGIAVQSDGKIVVSAVLLNGLGLARYSSNGTLDGTFGAAGVVTLATGLWVSAPVIQPDGKILVGGSYNNSGPDHGFVDRFNADGSFDSSFGASGQVLTTIGPSSEQNNFRSSGAGVWWADCGRWRVVTQCFRPRSIDLDGRPLFRRQRWIARP